MIFRQLTIYSHDMTSNKSQPTTDDIGLPVLRKSISEPKLLTDVDHHFAGRNHGHSASATPRIVIANGPSSRRHSVVLGEAAEESQLPRSVQGRGVVAMVTADRSIDMINPRNFPVVMTKNFLRRRANAVDVYTQSETSNMLNADRHPVGLRVTNGKYGSPAGPRADHSDQPRGILKRREHGSSRSGWQLEDGHKTRNDVTLPGMSWRKSEGSCVLAGFPGNKSDLQRGQSSAASSCSWQTYPLSSRPFSTHRGSKYLRGDQRVMSTNGFLARPNDGYTINTTNTRIRTRFTTPGQQEQATHLNNNLDRSDLNIVQLPSEDKADVSYVSKPTTESLQQKRATTANGRRKINANDTVDGVSEATTDEEDNRHFRVRDWLSSLDSTLCQRYARRQMASLREYELSNQKS